MNIFDAGSIFTIIVIFIVGAFVYSNPKNEKSLLELGSFCQTAAFLVSLIFALRNYEAFVGPYSVPIDEFCYFVTLNIYGSIINLGFKIFVRIKYKRYYDSSQ